MSRTHTCWASGPLSLYISIRILCEGATITHNSLPLFCSGHNFLSSLPPSPPPAQGRRCGGRAASGRVTSPLTEWEHHTDCKVRWGGGWGWGWGRLRGLWGGASAAEALTRGGGGAGRGEGKGAPTHTHPSTQNTHTHTESKQYTVSNYTTSIPSPAPRQFSPTPCRVANGGKCETLVGNTAKPHCKLQFSFFFL